MPLTGQAINGNPNSMILTTGPIDINDRPQQFKLTGTYILPWHEISVSGNYRAQSGPAIRRTVSTALQVGGTTTVNVEPFGGDRLDALRTLDLRASKSFALRGDDRIEVDMDVYNLTNANTVWEVNQSTGRTTFARTAIRTPRRSTPRSGGSRRASWRRGSSGLECPTASNRNPGIG